MIKDILIVLGIIVLFYLIISFIFLTFNTVLWGMQGRYILVAISIAVSVCTITIKHTGI